MKAPVQIETTRLLLRRPRPEDADAIFSRYASDPDVTRFLSWPTHRTIHDTRAFLAMSDDEWARWPAGPYLIELLREPRLLGGTGLAFDTTASATTGYALARDAWGRGYATEALSAMVELARSIGLRSLHTFCHAEHRASARVLAKNGFVCEGLREHHSIFPNLSREPRDVLLFKLMLQ